MFLKFVGAMTISVLLGFTIGILMFELFNTDLAAWIGFLSTVLLSFQYMLVKYLVEWYVKLYVLICLLVCLLFTVWNTTDGVSGDVMKAVMTISICSAICFVWVN